MKCFLCCLFDEDGGWVKTSSFPLFKLKLLYNGVLVSLYNKVNQLYAYIYPLLLISPGIPPHQGLQRTLSRAPCINSSFPLALFFTHCSVYMSNLISQFVPPSPSWLCPCLFSMSASVPALEIGSSVYKMILLSHSKEWNWVICRDVDGHLSYREKSERENQIYADAYT